METILTWMGGNWGYLVAAFCIFFEIAPIKLHPITFVLKWLGKKLTGDLRDDIKSLKEDTDAKFSGVEARQEEMEKAIDLQRVAGIRTLVLDFANSCLNSRKHTKEEFDHVLEEHKVYKALVEKHHIENEVYAESIAYIKRTYRKLLDKRAFLSAPTVHEDDDEEDPED